jgi:hypothetical protein
MASWGKNEAVAHYRRIIDLEWEYAYDGELSRSGRPDKETAPLHEILAETLKRHPTYDPKNQ